MFFYSCDRHGLAVVVCAALGGLLGGPGEELGKVGCDDLFFWKRRERREGEKKKAKGRTGTKKTKKLFLSNSLTRVEHHMQMQRARRAARDVLSRGELLLWCFLVGWLREEWRE